ncbi:MAG TPA: CHAT domain-containing protein [Leptospiraceae bacterium]|nr:CHAT domain-containing protein [Leptospiraceae bacterium]HMW07368.1 CHAT domain-containing protein [Leptospiraceae bacterium]HMX34779.1 CHAT domain-containing protein [Leptospiraceae bacterium]HMY32432.1 CHAT domain-containing protein [Leptospiraceae bacterium]HMZ64187.1 CHAT domain-containing protein [Leptospiraceae bacterium]
MIDLLIDRVGNVNIFNFLNAGQFHSESHIQSSIDTDLISEYVKEVENISKLSNNFIANHESNFRVKPNVLKDLKVLGETFYEQFFPSSISDNLRSTSEKYLHFNIDSSLAEIPWELLYDGECFLSDRFLIGRTIKGSKTFPQEENNEKLKMLIIADPTEDLEWAQKEGEVLFQVLKEKVPASVLDLEFIAGSQITKLKLLSMIRGKNIIHYAGHLFFSNDPMENGWLLSGDKILKAREIKNSAFSTNLVFSNSCNSSRSVGIKNSKSIINDFASSFLMSGIMSFIGTKWEVADNSTTLDFTIRFYLALFNDKSLGESLHIAREYARKNSDPLDLIWGNYSLYGHPDRIILNKNNNRRNKIIEPMMIRKTYPTPIAISYSNFISIERMDSTENKMKAFVNSFEEFTRLITIIVISDHKYKALNQNFENKEDLSLEYLWDIIFKSMLDFKKLQISMVVESFLVVLFSNKDLIYKIISWIQKFRAGGLDTESLEGYLITSQYYYENLLVELNEFEKCYIFYISNDSDRHCLFYGYNKKETEIDATQFGFFLNRLEEFRGRVILIHKTKKSILPLIGIQIKYKNDERDKDLSLDFMNFRDNIVPRLQ